MLTDTREVANPRTTRQAADWRSHQQDWRNPMQEIRKRFAIGACLALLAAVLVTPPQVQATGGCANPQVFTESQAWWTPNPGTTGGVNFGHIHVGACIPERDTLTANRTIPLRLIMHNNPGRLADISLVFKTTSQEVTVAKLVPSQRTCVGTCTITVSAPIDIMKFDKSGLQEIRFRVYVDEPDGNRMHASLNAHVVIANGKTLSNVSRLPYFRAKGWYTGYGYCEANITTVPLPDKPVSGVLNLKVKQVWHGTAEDVPPSHHLVALDADAHAGIAGTILRTGDGPLPETTISIDTTKLTNGTHKLVQRADCAKGNQVNSGVSVFLFDVANP
jgi:hypothetical protein